MVRLHLQNAFENALGLGDLSCLEMRSRLSKQRLHVRVFAVLLQTRSNGARTHREAGRRFAATMPFPHRGVGGLDIASEARRVEKRRTLAIVGKFLFE